MTGPSGRAPLAQSVRAVAQQHQRVAGLLSRKQDEALRQLLQGMIAREIAEKIFGAERLVDLMNRRLGAVATAHHVGVRLRWRRSRELDDATARLVELLAKQPDLRSEDEGHELREALSEPSRRGQGQPAGSPLSPAHRGDARLQAVARLGGDGATGRDGSPG